MNELSVIATRPLEPPAFPFHCLDYIPYLHRFPRALFVAIYPHNWRLPTLRAMPRMIRSV